MFRACTFVPIVAAGLAVAACGTDSAPTTPSPDAPSFRSEHSPDGPGAQVFHGNGTFFVTFDEPGAPYFVAVGVTPSAAREFCSGGDPDFAPYKETFIDGPNGLMGVLKSDGKAPLLLYPAGTEDICDGSPIAEGTARYTENSSNVVGGHGRGNDGFRIRGQVRDQAGERRHVLVVVRSHLGPDGFEDIVVKIGVK